MEPSPRHQDLAAMLEALASPARLAILHQLRSPRLLADIRVQASVSRPGENPERPLARQTVAHHVEQLALIGLVQRVPMPDGRGEGYVLHQSSLFAVLDEVRRLAKLRSVVGEGDGRETEPGPGDVTVALPPPPRLLVAYGREDGAAFGLADGRDRWTVGRAAGSDVRLDHDPWVSSEHAVIERADAGFAVTDLHSRNGTWVDWARLDPGRPARLRPGALLMIGRTIVAFQPRL